MEIGKEYLVLWRGKLVSPIKTSFGKEKEYFNWCKTFDKSEDAYREINKYGSSGLFSEFIYQIYKISDGIYEIFDNGIYEIVR